jgi:hypothetical protein
VVVLCLQLRHQKPLGFVGLWPEYSMMNHSCAPNTSILVVRERMLVSDLGQVCSVLQMQHTGL